MKQTTEEAILPFKVLELAEIISEKNRFWQGFLYHD